MSGRWTRAIAAAGLAAAAHAVDAAKPALQPIEIEPVTTTAEREWVVQAWGTVGTRDRVDGGLLLRRDAGDELDGQALAAVRERTDLENLPAAPDARRERLLGVIGGTDPVADDSGRGLAEAFYSERAWEGLIPLYWLQAGGGWSSQRRWLAQGDLTIGIVHAGAERDDFGHDFRLGFTMPGNPEQLPVTLTLDRVISYRAGGRFLSTELRVATHYPISHRWLLVGEFGYERDAVRPDASRDSGWFGSIGIGWSIDGDLPVR